MSLHLQVTTSNEMYDLDLEHTARNKVRAEVATIARNGLWIGDDEFIPASQIIRIKIQAEPSPPEIKTKRVRKQKTDREACLVPVKSDNCNGSPVKAKIFLSIESYSAIPEEA